MILAYVRLSPHDNILNKNVRQKFTPSTVLTSSRLTVGSTVGSIRELFTKVKAIDAKHGKFDLLLCTGDFFGPPKDDEPDTITNEDEIVQLLEGHLEGMLFFLDESTLTYIGS